MNTLIQRMASLAHGLNKAELHVLLELTARVSGMGGIETTASSRDLAETTGLARASVQTAIDSLNAKLLILSTRGNPMQPSVHRLLCLAPSEDANPRSPRFQNQAESGLKLRPLVAQTLSHGVPDFEPGVDQNLGQAGLMAGPPAAQPLDQGGLMAGPVLAQWRSQGGPNNDPGVAQKLGRGGPESEPSPNPESTTCESPPIERTSAFADSIDLELDKTIDRLQKAKRGDFDPALFELARNQMAGHHAKFAREGNRLPHGPDDKITAQFLAVAEWPRLEAMLLDLASERKEAGHSHAWYVTVALQRIHGISPDRWRQRRVRLRASPNPAATIHSSAAPVRPAVLNSRAQSRADPRSIVDAGPRGPDWESVKEQIRAWAEAKSM